MAKRCFEGNQKEKWFDLLLLLWLKGNIWTDSRQHLSGTHAMQLLLYALPDAAKTLIMFTVIYIQNQYCTRWLVKMQMSLACPLMVSYMRV